MVSLLVLELEEQEKYDSGRRKCRKIRSRSVENPKYLKPSRNLFLALPPCNIRKKWPNQESKSHTIHLQRVPPSIKPPTPLRPFLTQISHVVRRQLVAIATQLILILQPGAL